MHATSRSRSKAGKRLAAATEDYRAIQDIDSYSYNLQNNNLLGILVKIIVVIFSLDHLKYSSRGELAATCALYYNVIMYACSCVSGSILKKLL